MKAVLFDLGDTLIKTAPVSVIFKRILAPHGIQKSSVEISSALREVIEEIKPEDYALTFNEFWRAYNVKVLKQLRVKGNLEELADAVTNEWWINADVKSYPDVKETLRTLREMGLKIGIVTNCFQEDINEILSRTSLNGFFDVTVGVDAVGKPKPNEEIFLYALKKLGVSPQEAIFIGDNMETDYEGAEKAGLKALLIDRSGKIRARVRKIQSLAEIEKFYKA